MHSLPYVQFLPGNGVPAVFVIALEGRLVTVREERCKVGLEEVIVIAEVLIASSIIDHTVFHVLVLLQSIPVAVLQRSCSRLLIVLGGLLVVFLNNEDRQNCK